MEYTLTDIKKLPENIGESTNLLEEITLHTNQSIDEHY